jgi:putative redox protein
MGETKPLTVELSWEGGQRFLGRAGSAEILLDGDSSAGPNPVQTLAMALAGCMAIDVVHILTKGRHEPAALRAHLEAERAEVEPKRIRSVHLRFTIAGDVPPEKVERAIALSREKYCSVWHSLRQDIAFETAFTVTPA